MEGETEGEAVEVIDGVEVALATVDGVIDVDVLIDGEALTLIDDVEDGVGDILGVIDGVAPTDKLALGLALIDMDAEADKDTLADGVALMLIDGVGETLVEALGLIEGSVLDIPVLDGVIGIETLIGGVALVLMEGVRASEDDGVGDTLGVVDGVAPTVKLAVALGEIEGVAETEVDVLGDIKTGELAAGDLKNGESETIKLLDGAAVIDANDDIEEAGITVNEGRGETIAFCVLETEGNGDTSSSMFGANEEIAEKLGEKEVRASVRGLALGTDSEAVDMIGLVDSFGEMVGKGDESPICTTSAKEAIAVGLAEADVSERVSVSGLALGMDPFEADAVALIEGEIVTKAWAVGI